ncbi:MAG TPA: M28 family peptidase [Terriglobales bacterium]|nr:M28 family peptidase [Terriglobales bacterium]
MTKQICLLLLALSLTTTQAQTPKNSPAATSPKPATNAPVHVAEQKVCSACIQAHEEFLASDAMQGRGSATHDELVAATYIAAQLRAYGIPPAGDDGGYIQTVPLIKNTVTAPPTLEITPGNGSPATIWTYGKDFLISPLSAPDFSGPLQKIDSANPAKITPGAIVFVTGNPNKVRSIAFSTSDTGATGAIILSNKSALDFQSRARTLPRISNKLDGDSHGLGDFNFLELTPDAADKLAQLPDGTQIHFKAAAEREKIFTWNAVGILRGSDLDGNNATIKQETVLLSAHLDHLGIGRPVNGDSIYNGADDDASGVTAVLELARVLGAAPSPRRTVIFALFGSEETGVLGSTYFREHPPVPLSDFVANLEFEMIGRADPKVKADTVWLTGWERSNLGPALAAHGANLVPDPHPEGNFFTRSDNYVLAKKGVVAQTVSSYGMHSDYHRPSDDVDHLDFKHMDAAIGSMLAPVQWLVNSTFTPKWNEGGKP